LSGVCRLTVGSLHVRFRFLSAERSILLLARRRFSQHPASRSLATRAAGVFLSRRMTQCVLKDSATTTMRRDDAATTAIAETMEERVV
jgi:hypothetical protein